MNLLAIDVGNSNIRVGLFLDGELKSVDSMPGDDTDKLKKVLKNTWQQIPISKSSKQEKRDGVIVVSSVKPAWVEPVRKIAKNELGEKLLVIGDNIPLPIAMFVDEPRAVGTDRVVAAAAAYAVVEDAVVVADFGTALTIDLVDEHGVFQGGVICPGLAMEAKALKEGTAQLPQVSVKRPNEPYGKNTADAINCGLYYAAIGTLEEVIRRYAEKIGRWPQTILTGSAAKVIKADCEFIDNYVPDLVINGIALAYRMHLEDKSV
ncbi:MAG: type III pantothenate kinase [Phycisphaerae bacterium]|jgi:type III pantothenate kinase